MMFLFKRTTDKKSSRPFKEHDFIHKHRDLPPLLFSMEAEGCRQRWKNQLTDLKDSRRYSSLTTDDHESGRTESEKDRGGTHKSVTMAPTSRYLTDRQYVMRKPLFTAEQHTSILKKTHPQNPTEKEKQSGVIKREEDLGQEERNNLTREKREREREKRSPESLQLSHSDLSPLASRDDLDSPMGVSELRSRLFHDGPSFRSSLSGSRSTRRVFTSSVLEVQRLNPPLRPQLTSTVLHPTYTPLSGKSRDQARLRLRGREAGIGGETKCCSSGGIVKEKTMSPHQANYWACAIPKSLPPSPDRYSEGWDPNREYQALLDYTYPLRPGQGVTEWDSTDLQEDSLLQTDSNLQDSGIDLDHLCSSPSQSGLRTAQSRGRGTLSEGPRSPDLQGSTRSSGCLPSGYHLSLKKPLGLSLDSLDCCQGTGGKNLHKGGGHYNQLYAVPSSTSTFNGFRRSTSVLPRSRCICRDLDDEFWRLPDQLEELQLLSRQVKEVTAQLSRPVTTSWESLGPGTTSMLSSITLPDKQETEDKELEGNNEGTDEEKDEMGKEKRKTALSADYRVSGASVDLVEDGLSRSGLREVEALVEQLSGITLPCSQRSREEGQMERDSLMQHIKVFCSHLEQLIQQLYALSEKTELLAAPIVDIDSVKSSLAEYQSLQREVSSHQPLVSCVLRTGRLLLSCINTTSPFLRDTLLLIERQSGALENHTKHFFSSILSAMDSLTLPGPAQQSREEDQGPAGD